MRALQQPTPLFQNQIDIAIERSERRVNPGRLRVDRSSLSLDNPACWTGGSNQHHLIEFSWLFRCTIDRVR
jgi:hypothetical protein